MEGCSRQMQCITAGVIGHHVMSDVGLDSLCNRIVQIEQSKPEAILSMSDYEQRPDHRQQGKRKQPECADHKTDCGAQQGGDNHHHHEEPRKDRIANIGERPLGVLIVRGDLAHRIGSFKAGASELVIESAETANIGAAKRACELPW